MQSLRVCDCSCFFFSFFSSFRLFFQAQIFIKTHVAISQINSEIHSVICCGDSTQRGSGGRRYLSWNILLKYMSNTKGQHQRVYKNIFHSHFQVILLLLDTFKTSRWDFTQTSFLSFYMLFFKGYNGFIVHLFMCVWVSQMFHFPSLFLLRHEVQCLNPFFC